MTPHEQILYRLHLERLAAHEFAMLMLRLAVRIDAAELRRAA